MCYNGGAMDPIGKLFGSGQRAKFLRLFLFNPEEVFDREHAARRVRTTPAVASRELQALTRMGITKRRMVPASALNGRGGRRAARKRGWTLNARFPYVEELREFLLATLPVGDEDVVRELRRHGRLRLVVLSGFFLREWDTRLDLLVVGERLREGGIAQAVHVLEGRLGRELKFAALESDDYRYRVNIQDRLVRDVFDYPHRVIYDRMEV